jgi:hypothetical protein
VEWNLGNIKCRRHDISNEQVWKEHRHAVPTALWVPHHQSTGSRRWLKGMPPLPRLGRALLKISGFSV